MNSVLNIPVFVIHLDRDTERRAHMEQALEKLGINREFVAAVDGSRLHQTIYQRYDRKRCLRVYGVDMLPAEVGCYLSHFSLFERIIAEGIETALILEDDIVFNDDFADVINGLLAMEHVPWKVIRLTTLRPKVATPGKPKFFGTRLGNVCPGYDLFRLKTHVLSAGAYLINQFGARAMVDYGQNFFMPIDHTMDRFWENGVLPHVVRPFPAQHRQDVESSIGVRAPQRRKDAPLPLRIQRRMQRLQDSVNKRVFNFRQF